MPAPIDIFRGFEKMEAEFTMREFNADVARHMVTTDMTGSGSLQVRMVGAQLLSDGTAEAVEWEIGGQFTEHDPGEIDAADPQTEMRFMCTCSRVKLVIAGNTIWDIDVPQAMCLIDGVDVWEGVRAILEG